MSAVSTSKSLFVIGGIEKYGKFSKKKKLLKNRVRKRLHLGPSKDEKAEQAEAERNARIEEKAKAKEERNGGERQQEQDQDGREGSSDANDSDEGGAIEGDLHDDIPKDQLSDKQRAERAVALIRSAMSKGLKGEEKKVENQEEVSRAKEDKAQSATHAEDAEASNRSNAKA